MHATDREDIGQPIALHERVQLTNELFDWRWHLRSYTCCQCQLVGIVVALGPDFTDAGVFPPEGERFLVSSVVNFLQLSGFHDRTVLLSSGSLSI
ncbi:hypothetical protein D3C85_1668440 [compost metagenome]